MLAKKRCTTNTCNDGDYEEGGNSDVSTAGMSPFHNYIYSKSHLCLSGKRRRTSQTSDDEDISSSLMAGMCYFQEAICGDYLLETQPCPPAKKQHTKSVGAAKKKYPVVSDDEDEGDGDITAISCMCHSKNHPR